MVEGLVGRDARHNESDHGRHIIENGPSRDSKHPNAFASEPGIANLIFRRLIPTSMSLAIDLDRQFLARAEEIEHIAARRMLVTKLHASRPRT